MSINGWMIKEDVVYAIYNGILLSYKKKSNLAICNNMGGPWGMLNEINQKEKEKYHMILHISVI